MNYETAKLLPSSEKITLARVMSAKRLIAWSLHAGSIYKISGFDFSVIDSITEDGVGMTEVSSLGAVVTNAWFNDRTNKIIYIRTSDSTHPNGKFISMHFWNFFSSIPITAPYDLDSGKEVFWSPMIKSTSLFGVELDNNEQLGFALEGSGTLSLNNDREYWDTRFEGYVFEQQPVQIYSWFKGIAFSEAKLIYRGVINAKTLSASGISLKIKDTLAQLRAEYELENISELGSALVTESLMNAKQRRIYGKVYGYRPTNIDQVVDGYLLNGTVTVSAGGTTVTGTSTAFLTHFSPDDQIVIDDEEYTIKSVSSNTSMEINDTFDFDFVNEPYEIKPGRPKTFTNRVWLIAGHECRQPVTTITNVDSLNRIYLNDLTDIDEGDQIFVDASGGEVVTVRRTNSQNLVVLAQNLVVTPTNGTVVTRFCAQNVRINNRRLEYNRDYTLDFSGGVTRLILDEEAEKNINPVRAVIGSSVVFNNGSRVVTGVGTLFASQLLPDQWIRSTAQFDFYQILSIDSDTQLTLRTAAAYTESDTAQYIADQAFDEGVDVLTCEIIGTTDDGTTDGTLLRTASKIVEHVVDHVGIGNLSASAFARAHEVQPAYLGLVIPDKFTDTRQPKCRDIINRVNQSVFGSLVQNEDFEIEYNILQPKKPSNFLTLREEDILDISVESNNDRVVKTAIINYKFQEYNAQSGIPSVSSMTKNSDIGSWLVESMNTKVVDTLLHVENDARIHASRWAFLLELATNTIKIKTKMIASRLQVNDVVFVEHEKLFERVGGGKRKFAAVQSIKKSGTNVDIELDDLANAFNRVAIIATTGSPEFDDSNAKQKATNGFITDQYGLINNNESTHGLNLIW